MIPFHEGLHCDLPIGRQHRGIPPFGPHLIDPIFFELLGARADALAQPRKIRRRSSTAKSPITRRVARSGCRAFPSHCPKHPPASTAKRPNSASIPKRFSSTCSAWIGARLRHCAIARSSNPASGQMALNGDAASHVVTDVVTHDAPRLLRQRIPHSDNTVFTVYDI